MRRRGVLVCASKSALLLVLLSACGTRTPIGSDAPASGHAPSWTETTPSANSTVDDSPEPLALTCRTGRDEAVDQSNIAKQNGGSGSSRFAQTFQPSRDGALTAIEIARYRCDRKASGRLRMTVLHGRGVDGAVVATAEAIAPATDTCDLVYLPLLHPTQRGPVTFDFTHACVAVERDRDYTFLVEPLDETETFITGRTVPSGVGAAYDSYPRGAGMTEVDGVFELGGNIGGDLTFKTYVEP